MNIKKALVVYGYINFKLDILEYCEPSVLLEREQCYLDTLKPEYNILKTAGSTAGIKRSEATILKFKTIVSNKSEETLAKLRRSPPPTFKKVKF